MLLPLHINLQAVHPPSPGPAIQPQFGQPGKIWSGSPVFKPRKRKPIPGIYEEEEENELEEFLAMLGIEL